MGKLISKGRKSATQLLEEHKGQSLEIMPPASEGKKSYFVLGDMVGYVSPAVAALAGKTNEDGSYKLTATMMQFAYTKDSELPDTDPVTNESNWVPCLMMVGNRPKPLQSFSL